MPKSMVGLAALRLVDPHTRQVISQDRWLYATELSKLLIDLGFDVCWWQLGNGWRAEILPQVPLYGVLRDDAQLFTWPHASNDFWDKAGQVDWAIYFDLRLAYPQALDRSIGIMHEVYWDDPLFESRLPTNAERQEWLRRTWMAIQGPHYVVATDTGFIQWANTTWPGLYNKFVYIPNFVPPLSPTMEYSIENPSPEERDTPKVRVLFPGHLVPGDGISEAVRAMAVLLAKYPHLEFHITGTGAKTVNQYMAEWAAKNPRAYLNPEPLTPKVLAGVDIVLCPAKSHQGTSFLCLQAMAAGKAVIVGQTGGLPDLVLHGHSGIIVPPIAERLLEAVDDLLTNPTLRTELGRNAQEVATTFSTDAWRRRWSRLLERTFMERC